MATRLVFLCVLAARLWGASYRIEVDISKAPEEAARAERSKVVCEEWYPKINEILYGSDHPLPFAVVLIVFEPIDGAAYTLENVIHVSSRYIKVMPDDYRAMVIHELAHVNQHYAEMPQSAGWLGEGIADYVRHKYYEKDIVAKLADKKGLEQKGYLKGYTVTSPFLFWLERWKDKNIVRELNTAFSKGKYSDGLFKQYCGVSLDALWEEFYNQLPEPRAH